jgi:uncharacterized membrane protein YcgQ (UPF0703/DUF1980 family)
MNHTSKTIHLWIWNQIEKYMEKNKLTRLRYSHLWSNKLTVVVQLTNYMCHNMMVHIPFGKKTHYKTPVNDPINQFTDPL